MQITKPRTQRRKMFQAPAHIRYKYFSASLSPDLKKRHGTNAIPVRVGDTVHVMRGDRKGFEGKITRVDRQKYRIFVEGVTREKVDGTAVQIPIHPSKVTITNLNLDDKWRRKTLERKGIPSEKEVPSVTEKAAEKKKEEAKKPQAEKVAKKPKAKKKKEAPARTTPKKPAESKAAKTEKPKRKRTKKTTVEEGAE